MCRHARTLNTLRTPSPSRLFAVGEGMVRRLINTAGRNVVVWNRSSEKCEALATEAGADRVKIAKDPAEVIETCSIIYLMLSTPEAVRSVYDMERGVFAGVSAGKCLIDCATLAVEDFLYLNEGVTKRGGRFLEAPVSGSKGPAAAGQLIFLCGGDEVAAPAMPIRSHFTHPSAMRVECTTALLTVRCYHSNVGALHAVRRRPRRDGKGQVLPGSCGVSVQGRVRELWGECAGQSE